MRGSVSHEENHAGLSDQIHYVSNMQYRRCQHRWCTIASLSRDLRYRVKGLKSSIFIHLACPGSASRSQDDLVDSCHDVPLVQIPLSSHNGLQSVYNLLK